MSAIHYLSQLDRINAQKTYKPMLQEMTKTQLEILVHMLLNEVSLEYAFSLVVALKEPN